MCYANIGLFELMLSPCKLFMAGLSWILIILRSVIQLLFLMLNLKLILIQGCPKRILSKHDFYRAESVF